MILKRVRRMILKTVRAFQSVVGHHFFPLSIKEHIMHWKLTIVISLANFDDDCLAKKILCARCLPAEKLFESYSNILARLIFQISALFLIVPFFSPIEKLWLGSNYLTNSVLQVTDDSMACHWLSWFKFGRLLCQWLVGPGGCTLSSLY